MKTYQFCAFGNTFCVDVIENAFGKVFENGDAMVVANKEFLWKLKDFIKNPSGEWRQVNDHCFEWAQYSPGYWD